MNWGDVPAWAALALAIVAGRVAWLARKDSQRSAEASVRSAVAAEESLALQRAEAEERRQANLPQVRLLLEFHSGSTWVFRNVGDRTAARLTVLPENLPYSTSGLPRGDDLEPGAGRQIMLMGAAGRPLPAHLLVTYEGQEEPVAVAIPPRRH
jgi:hypothetical protein